MSIALGTGIIARADAAKKLYKVTLNISPYSELPAVPVGGLNTLTGENGVVSCTSYAIGDHVLFAHIPVLSEKQSTVAWILGKIPRTTEYKDNRPDAEKWRLFPSIVSDLVANSVNNTVNTTLQEDIYLGNYSGVGNFPIDDSSGDFSVGGERTFLNVGDYAVNIITGRSKLLLDSTLGIIKQSSLLYDRFTLGESDRTQYYNGHLIYTRKLNSNPKILTEHKNSDSKFPYREQFSDLIYGHREELLDSDGRPLTQLAHNLDGSVILRAANTITLERTVRIPNHSINKDDSFSVTTPKDAASDNKQTKKEPFKAILNNPDWAGKGIIDGSDNIIETIFDMAGVTSWEAPASNSNIKFKNCVVDDNYEVADGRSGLDILPDGTILIRDAWGSEIRMGHGNVQISAANNLTTISGRDHLSIVSGVSSTSAGNGIELGVSDGNIAVGASNGTIKVASKDVTLSANTYKEHISSIRHSKAHITNTEVDIREERIKVLSTTAAHIMQINSEEQCTITTKGCGITLANNLISMGATLVDVHGNLAVNKEKYTVEDVVRLDNTTKDLVVPGTQAYILSAGGVITDGVVYSNSSVFACEGCYADLIAAYNAPRHKTYGYGIYKLTSKPGKQKQNNIWKKSCGLKQYFSKDLLNLMKSTFSQTALKSIGAIFTRTSRAFKIIQPLFSLSGKGKTNTKPATCLDKNGNVSYIYPGKSFWESDGMVTISTTVTDVLDRGNITVTGCKQLKLNTPNNLNGG
jgi:hypothetical protein